MSAGTRAGRAVLVSLLALSTAPAFAASDAQLARRIEARLDKAGFQQRADVKVDVESGVARLTGIVLRWADVRERGIDIQGRPRGDTALSERSSWVLRQLS